jgi:hypothetical protein
MIEYKGYHYNIIDAKILEGPQGSIFSIWQREGDTLKIAGPVWWWFGSRRLGT